LNSSQTQDSRDQANDFGKKQTKFRAIQSQNNTTYVKTTSKFTYAWISDHKLDHIRSPRTPATRHSVHIHSNWGHWKIIESRFPTISRQEIEPKSAL